MAEIRRGFDGEARPERLPWLEPVEDEGDYGYPEGAPGYGGVILAAIVVLAVIALLTAGALWYRRHRAATADAGQIIRAPAQPYKVRPTDPGGMRPDRSGEIISETGAGADLDNPVDLAGVPEEPVTGPGSATATATVAPPASAGASIPPAAAPARTPPPAIASASAKSAPPPAATKASVAPPPPKPVPAAPVVVEQAPTDGGAGGGAIQLGAFSSDAKARAAWKSLSGRFGFLHDMTMTVSQVTAGDRTLYRLRASGGGAPARLCAQLRVAGESCAAVGG